MQKRLQMSVFIVTKLDLIHNDFQQLLYCGWYCDLLPLSCDGFYYLNDQDTAVYSPGEPHKYYDNNKDGFRRHHYSQTLSCSPKECSQWFGSTNVPNKFKQSGSLLQVCDCVQNLMTICIKTMCKKHNTQSFVDGDVMQYTPISSTDNPLYCITSNLCGCESFDCEFCTSKIQAFDHKEYNKHMWVYNNKSWHHFDHITCTSAHILSNEKRLATIPQQRIIYHMCCPFDMFEPSVAALFVSTNEFTTVNTILATVKVKKINKHNHFVFRHNKKQVTFVSKPITNHTTTKAVGFASLNANIEPDVSHLHDMIVGKQYINKNNAREAACVFDSRCRMNECNDAWSNMLLLSFIQDDQCNILFDNEQWLSDICLVKNMDGFDKDMLPWNVNIQQIVNVYHDPSTHVYNDCVEVFYDQDKDMIVIEKPVCNTWKHCLHELVGSLMSENQVWKVQSFDNECLLFQTNM
jgi:hypothetical protein